MLDLSLSDWLQIAKPLLSVLGWLLFVAIFYWPGRLILRFLSNGRYPVDENHNAELVATVPLLILLLGLTVYYS